ncbi:hypothetical protein [Kistimonas scapharcae]|uniref:hypothetical protein n=1 Tax=Kistimonas scapharcae TaxID=1036133 RepID=UPI0031E5F115
METKTVPPSIIADLPNKYWARRIPSESRQNPAVLYKGVVFRADDGFHEEENGVKVFRGIEYFFEHGFTQQYINAREYKLDFDTVSGRSMSGKTLKAGISTTYDYNYAIYFCSMFRLTNVYIIDLFEHPFSIDITYSSRAYGYRVRMPQCEVNVPNSIDRSLIFGNYNTQSRLLTFNPHYDGIIELD